MPDSYVEHSGLTTEGENTVSSVVKFTTLDTWSRSILTSRDETFNIMHNNDADLMDALKRPVLLAAYNWEINNTISLRDIDLLQSWISSSTIVNNRMQRYKYLSGTFCIKVTVNGSPFMYGKAILSAQPWADIAINGSGSGIPLTNQQLTSLPYISITPTNATAGCMEIPILHPNGALDLTQYTKPISLHLQSLTPLSSVQDTTDNCQISVWCWMKDYQLSVPTHLTLAEGYTEQSGDEYSKPVVSTTATTIANFLGRLRDWPYIGPYARASEIGARAGGQIAQLFGYSKPSQIIEPSHMQNRPLGNLSNFNGTDSSVKLALDSKQEITIDPSVTGYGGPDDMIVLDIAKRESLLTKFVWRSSYTPGYTLWRSLVNPGICETTVEDYSTTLVDVPVLQTTPLAHVSYPFQYWRGTLKFRFEIIASPFHKGKLRFVYEPCPALGANGPWTTDTSMLTSHIVDLSTEREFVMEVGWGQAENYKEVASSMDVPDLASNPLFTANPLLDLALLPSKVNGVIGVSVINQLSCNQANDVEIMVYISAGDDFELQVPSIGLIGRLHTNLPQLPPGPLARKMPSITELPDDYVEQSGEIGGVPGVGDAPSEDVVQDMTLYDSTTAPVLVDKLAHIHFGERVVSIRQLLKRYCHNTVLYLPTVFNNVGLYRFRLADFPPYPGSDPEGQTLSLDGRWNFASPANYLNYFTPCFLMRRGAIRNKYVVYDMTDSSLARVPNYIAITASRVNSTGYAANIVPYNNNPVEPAFLNPILSGHHLHGAAGAAVVVPRLNNAIEVEMPYYSNRRWYFAQDRQINRTLPAENLRSVQDLLRAQTFHALSIEMSTKAMATNSQFAFVRRYTSAGDDFSLHYYTFPPVLYVVDPLNYPPGPV